MFSHVEGNRYLNKDKLNLEVPSHEEEPGSCLVSDSHRLKKAKPSL